MDYSKRSILTRLLLITECLCMMVSMVNGYGSSLSPWTSCHGDGCCETRTHGNVIIIAKVVDEDTCDVVSSTYFPPSNPTAITDIVFTTDLTPGETTTSEPLTATVTKSSTTERSSTTTSSTTSEPSPSTSTTTTATTSTTTTEASTTEDYTTESVTPIVSESSAPFTNLPSGSPFTDIPNFTTDVFQSTTTACIRPEPMTGTIIVISKVIKDRSCVNMSTPLTTSVFESTVI